MLKRKADTMAHASSPMMESRGSKRRRTQYDPVTGEQLMSTQQVGRAYIDQLRQTKDKRGRSVITSFISLPDRNEVPEYYDIIRLPVSIETIEAKIERDEYLSVSEIEGDAKRLITNAKEINDKNSDTYLDAERIRKMTSEFMKRNNPAYNDPQYKAVPTPVHGENPYSYTMVEIDAPGEPDIDIGFAQYDPPPAPPSPPQTNGAPINGEPEIAQQSNEAPIVDQETPVQVVVANQNANGTVIKRKRGRPRRESSPVTAAPPPEIPDEPVASPNEKADAEANEDGKGGDFAGLTFQAAQEKLIAELLNYESEPGVSGSSPFVNLPPRSLKDYYSLIKTPTSIKGIEKRVNGIYGKAKVGTGVSEYQSWDSFENAVAFIWNNAREYNEDGSDLYTLATELETFFLGRLKEAKEVVHEPSMPKVRLNVSQPKILLRVGGGSGQQGQQPSSGSPGPTTAATSSTSPAPSAAATSRSQLPGGVSVDNGALQRQQQQVQAAVNGSAHTTRSASAGSPTMATRSSATATSGALASSAIKPESSPSLAASHPALVRVGSEGSSQRQGSPSATTNMGPPGSSGAAGTTAAAASPRQEGSTPHHHPHHNTHHTTPIPGYDTRFRAPGKEAKDALFSAVVFSATSSHSAHQRHHQFSPPSASSMYSPHNQNSPAVVPMLNDTNHTSSASSRSDTDSKSTEQKDDGTFSVSIPPSANLAQYSRTIWLPTFPPPSSSSPTPPFQPVGLNNSNNAGGIIARVAPTLNHPAIGKRQYRTFCTVNDKRITDINNATRRPPASMGFGMSMGTGYDGVSTPQTGHLSGSGIGPVYEFQLSRGVNRIEMEIIAAPSSSSKGAGNSGDSSPGNALGAKTTATGEMIEVEKVLIFACIKTD